MVSWALVAAASEDVRMVTSTADFVAGRARLIIELRGYARPILPALLLRLGEAVTRAPPLLE